MEIQQKWNLLWEEWRVEREASEKRAHDRWKARREKMAARREEMVSWRAKMDPDEKAWREKMAAMRAKLVAETEALRAESRAIQARTEATLARMDANMKSHEAKMEASNKEFFARMYYDRKTTEAPLEEEKPALVDTKPEAAQEEDAIVIPVGESEEEMTSITRKETMASQEMEARLEEEEEPTSVDMKPEAAEQGEVPVGDAIVIQVGESEEEMTSITRKETMACQEMEARLEEE
jgi:hypothetical protein